MSECEEDAGVGRGHHYCLGCERVQDGACSFQSHEICFVVILSSRFPHSWLSACSQGHVVPLVCDHRQGEEAQRSHNRHFFVHSDLTGKDPSDPTGLRQQPARELIIS